MKLYKKRKHTKVISFPTENVEKGDYLLVEDLETAKALIAQVIDVQFGCPRSLEVTAFCLMEESPFRKT